MIGNTEIPSGEASLLERSAEAISLRTPDLVEHVERAPQSLLDALPAAVYVCDVAGLIMRYNRRAAELWGRAPRLADPADRFCGSLRLYGLDGRLIPHAECPMADVLRTGQAVREAEAVIERPDGSRITALVSIEPLRDAAGAISGALNCFHDITERKAAEAALREGERRWRELIEALPAAIYTTDAAGRITFYNQAAVELAGRRPELGSDKWCVSWRLYTPDGTPLAHDECPMAVALREGRAIRGVEAVLERPDGTRVPFMPYPTPLRDASGAVVGAINMLMDIRAQKQAEGARGQLAAIVESSNDAIVGKGLDGVVTSWNKAAETLFGYSADEIVGRSITTLFPEDRINEEAMILDRIRRGRRVDGYETVRRCKDGREINVSVTVSPVRDAAGRIIGASKIARDIGERKRIQDALRASEERHRGLAEAIASVVWTTDAEGQVTDMPQWRALTGQSRQEVRGFGWLDAIHPNDRARTHEVWTRAVKAAVACDTECRVRTAGGEYRWYNARGVPVLRDDGSIREWVGVCIDITQSKQSEEKTKLLAREVNHRANNLLTLLAAMMRQTRADTVPEFIVSMQGRINALARVQGRLARDQWDRTNLLKLIDEELTPFAKDIGGRFTIVGPDKPLGPVAAQALAIIIHELATNAVKYGSLSVSVGRVAIEWAIAGDRLTLSWTETGGPATDRPTREGFGTRAISMLSQQLGGAVSAEWRPGGLACTLAIPMQSLED